MDSGVGGLSVFREIRKLLPSEHYVYYSDSANCPYGEKDPEFIRRRCREITRTMLSKGASAMVIACNTATAVQDGIRVVEHVGRGFVELVERGELDGPSAEETVSRSLRPLLAEGADIIVLGCTHYPFLLPLLQRVAGPGIRFIDPAPAVARHLLDLLEQNGIGRSDALPDIELLGSGDPVQLRNSYRMLIGGQ